MICTAISAVVIWDSILNRSNKSLVLEPVGVSVNRSSDTLGEADGEGYDNESKSAIQGEGRVIFMRYFTPPLIYSEVNEYRLKIVAVHFLR